MLKRLRLWTYMALASGASLYQFGCGGGGWWPYNGDAGSWPRIITAILREDLWS